MYNFPPRQVEVKQEEEFTLPKGSVLKLTGLGGEITREDIKEVGRTRIIDFSRTILRY